MSEEYRKFSAEDYIETEEDIRELLSETRHKHRKQGEQKVDGTNSSEMRRKFKHMASKVPKSRSIRTPRRFRLHREQLSSFGI